MDFPQAKDVKREILKAKHYREENFKRRLLKNIDDMKKAEKSSFAIAFDDTMDPFSTVVAELENAGFKVEISLSKLSLSNFKLQW